MEITTNDSVNVKPPVPAKPIHPGAMIKNKIKEKGWRGIEVATIMGIGNSHLSSIITGNTAISAPMAMKLQAVFGIDAVVWLTLQMNYELYLLKKDRSLQKEVRRIKEVKKQFR